MVKTIDIEEMIKIEEYLATIIPFLNLSPEMQLEAEKELRLQAIEQKVINNGENYD